MDWPRFRRLALAVATIAVVAAGCSLSSSPGTSSTDWAKATSAGAGGGLNALVAAARAEGSLTVIGLPPDRANYSQLIGVFEQKYGINVTSLDPSASSQDEVVAFDRAGRAPDVVDIDISVAMSNAGRFAPYQVTDWNDIPAGGKEPSGAWYNDYGGYMGIGYDSSKVPTISSVQDLLGPDFHGMVALAGDPTRSNEGLNGVIMASVVNGGSLDDVSKGVDFFHQLMQIGNYVPVVGTDATVKSGRTPVLFEWDFMSAVHVKAVPTWRVFVPSNAIIGGYYSQAINRQAAHPAAARLWEEFLYSDQGQNLWLGGGVRPVRQAAMTAAGTVDVSSAAALPQVSGWPQIPTGVQTSEASTYVQANWAQAVA